MRGPLVVMIGITFIREVVTLLEFFGYSVALCGFVWYNYAKANQQVAASTEHSK